MSVSVHAPQLIPAKVQKYMIFGEDKAPHTDTGRREASANSYTLVWLPEIWL